MGLSVFHKYEARMSYYFEMWHIILVHYFVSTNKIYLILLCDIDEIISWKSHTWVLSTQTGWPFKAWTWSFWNHSDAILLTCIYSKVIKSGHIHIETSAFEYNEILADIHGPMSDFLSKLTHLTVWDLQRSLKPTNLWTMQINKSGKSSKTSPLLRRQSCS